LKNRTRIVYAIDVDSNRRPDTRVSRTEQSAAAQRLLERLAGDARPKIVWSKSHSRAGIAVAVGDGDGIFLGIDLEWIAANRSYQAIARDLLGDDAGDIGATDFYRLWTFYEAYFKAFRRTPRCDLLREIVTRAVEPSTCRLSDGTRVLQRSAPPGFQLCLVWSDTHDSEIVPYCAEDAEPNAGAADGAQALPIDTLNAGD
jgi:hypothetical protein